MAKKSEDQNAPDAPDKENKAPKEKKAPKAGMVGVIKTVMKKDEDGKVKKVEHKMLVEEARLDMILKDKRFRKA